MEKKKKMSVRRLLLRLVPCFLSWVAWPAAGYGHEIKAIQLPLTFEENRGQTESSARYLAHLGRGAILLSDKGVTLVDGRGRRSVRMRLLQSRKVRPLSENPTGGFANYYESKDREAWISHVPMFSQVRYAGVYSGVDAVFHGHGSQMEYDFELTPGTSPNAIAITFDGAERVIVAEDGGLDVVSGESSWHLLPPAAYQECDNLRKPVPAQYEIISDHSVRFRVTWFDPSLKLVIDPVVDYAGPFPGNDLSAASAMQLDTAGNLIFAGYYSGYGYPGYEAAVVKLNPADNTVLYKSYIGTIDPGVTPFGQFNALIMALDNNGNAYVSGNSSSADFPTTATIGSCGGACYGGFVAKLSPDGSLIYSTLVHENIASIAVDSSGSAFITGATSDNLLPTVNAFQPTNPNVGAGSAFFAKLNPSGTAYDFASYFSSTGGSPNAMAIALDPNGNVFIAGITTVDPPLVNPWQSGMGGIFLSKFAPDGKTLLFSTRFGGSTFSPGSSGLENLVGMAIGTDGTVYLAGNTPSMDFPFALNSPAHQVLPSGNEMFATAIDPSLTKLTYSDYLGKGSIGSIFLDSSGHLYVGGSAMAGDTLPLMNSMDSDTSGGFFLELDTTGLPLIVSRFGGHYTTQQLAPITVDGSGNLYMATGWGGAEPLGGQTNFYTPYEDPASELCFGDPILVGTPAGSLTQGLPGNSGEYGVMYIARISPANSPQISLSPFSPFLALRNAGTADLHISSIQFTGLSGSEGVVSGNCGKTVPAGTSCILTVAGPNGIVSAGSVKIVSDADPTTQTFSIQIPLICSFDPCPPVADQLWLSDTRGDYPPQLQGTPQTIPITVSNIGVANATINKIYAQGDLSETDNCGAQSSPATLPPGASCIVQLTSTPNGLQGGLSFIYDGTIFQNFYEGDIFRPVITQSQLLLSASSPNYWTAINFGTQQVNGVALPRVVTITNTGDTLMAAPAVSISGAPQFILTGNTCPSSIASHQSCAVGVQFVPVDDSAPTATLNIGGQSVTLAGQGQISSAIQVSPLEVDFYPVWPFSVGYQTLVLTNSTGTPVGIASVSFSLPDFTETDGCQSQIPANGACTMQILFSPQRIGQRNGTMTITLAGGFPAEVINVEGLGVDPMVVTPQALAFGSPTPGTSSVPQYLSLVNRGGLPPLEFLSFHFR